ncbi:MAG: 30S ribosomal protein S12 methylthiotransferase RimO [Bacteroidales bacterium]|nr:30S ribosomal protein S12 methylthiotransferase RimO [Bacteroidales bacterium]
MKKPTIDFITMGCSKNLVDSERLLSHLEYNGFEGYHNPEETHGNIAVVNTCGFIGDAKEESINMILDLCQQKEEGKLKKVFVMGCLSERYQKELRQEIPQVDAFFGKFNWARLLDEVVEGHKSLAPIHRKLTTPKHYAFLKISEGCDRNCAFCAIPIITGRHKSRPKEEIIDEVRTMVAQGVKEFQIIAQELTFYGIDLYKKQCIAELVEAIADVEGVEWVRLHYAYPTNFPMDLLRVIRERKNVCNYLDIALQHISTPVLKRMERHINKEQTYELIRRMRTEVPEMCIRTTLMVGFPGETEEEFEELKQFVRDAKFDRMGAFTYSEEEGTKAAALVDDVPEAVKQRRLDELMAIQQEVSAARSATMVGRTLRTIIDRAEGDYYIGRTEYDSPEVDGEVLIKKIDTLELVRGQFYDVHITSADEFDLYGYVV